MSLRILYVGEAWQGSCARSLREALDRREDVDLTAIEEDHWFPKPPARWRRALQRLVAPALRSAFEAHVAERARDLRPAVFMTYKGHPVHAGLLDTVRRLGAMTVNVYPDLSPHAHGRAHRIAVGAYDLVISTKQFHSAHWRATYGYRNPCEFVPQGYDPKLHLVTTPVAAQAWDVVLLATWRPEYGRLVRDLARELGDTRVRVAIGGNGWENRREDLPREWVLLGGVDGRRYVETLRMGRICLAPLTRDMVVDGERQPGDVDTTRTYELAAAHCFFVHRRTEFVTSLYDERLEVPMFDDAAELAAHIRWFLPREDARREMAAAAHRRAVPAYSLDARAGEIVSLLRRHLDDNSASRSRRP